MSESVIIIGAGGHGKVIADLVLAAGDHILGFLDDDLSKTSYRNIPVLGPISSASCYCNASFIIAIGDNHTRAELASNMKLRWYTAIHPSAVISPSAKIGAGSMILANATVNADSVIGDHCIINTASVVEHENRIGNFVHLSSRVVLGGCVQVDSYCHIGIGVCVRNCIHICSDCVIGAGAAVVSDISAPGTYIGVPAKIMPAHSLSR